MKIYGKAETWAYYNMDSGGGDVHTVTPAVGAPRTVIGDESWNQTGTVDSVTYARFGFTTTTPSSFGDVNTKLELEARSDASHGNSWGSGGNFRIRHAYGEFAGLLVGQTNDLFVDWQYCPAYNDTWHEDFNGSTYRARQIRYTFAPTKEFKFALAVENDHVSATSKLGNALAAAANYSAGWGFVTATVLYQKKEADTLVNGGLTTNNWVKTSGTGTSFTVGGAWNITPNDTLGFRMIKGGDQGGSGVYGLADGFYQKAGSTSFDFYKSTSMDLGYSHTWNDQFNTNVGYGQIKFGKDTNFGLGEDVTLTEFFINTNWNVTKNATFAAEYLDSAAKESDFNDVTKKDGSMTNKFHNAAFNLMFQYRFF
jgi:hypothetical protein